MANTVETDSIDQLPEVSRNYLNSLVQVVNEKMSFNPDYHRYYHYLLNKAKQKWTEEEKSIDHKLKAQRESESKKTCRFCGCTRRTIKIRTKKIKGVKLKYLFNRCKLCNKLSALSKQGMKVPKTSDVKPTEPKSMAKSEFKPTPKPEVVSQKIENFDTGNTIKQLNYLLKGGKGGKKLNLSQLQKSKLIDLLI